MDQHNLVLRLFDLPDLPEQAWLASLLGVAAHLTAKEAQSLAERRPLLDRFLEVAIEEAGVEFDKAWWSVDIAVTTSVEGAAHEADPTWDPRDPWSMPIEFVDSSRILQGVALALSRPTSLSPATVEALLAPLPRSLRERMAVGIAV